MKKILFILLLIVGLADAFAQKSKYPTKFTVAQDGSGDFKTIQEAIMAFRDHSQERVTLFIKNGIYHEKIVIPPNKPNLHLLGESSGGVIITNDDYSGKVYPNGQKDATGKSQFSTYNSFTVLVDAPDIIIENLTIQNTSGRVGQAVALHVEGDRFICKNCLILGNQDTLYAAREGSQQYYVDCQIEGTTDFIFGKSICVFEKCIIKSLSNSFITAAATPAYQAYGFVFLDCKLTADSSAQKVYLGRPWRPYSKTVFIRTEMDSHILPIGWNNWGNTDNEKTVLYAEYASYGSGANMAQRVAWSRQLKKKEADNYSLERIFGSRDTIKNWWKKL
ncbi:MULTISPECIES: pectinesterase family protein [unclassified Arcicella]|uniref:pectinesterase family protein n=1 Tax=unclassified Arcicella TaxID=2644986 RepID=UPI00285880A9|nr:MULTISPECIES: pectinesterase family protein [unclassified Arcicella]MDR6562417.1 pectinesterase [Arcicella sp. BE51]MDR6812311.1 pectinesterase [Arcicella sp. BE140]MDR6823642.1 pectinesterase [Arcicella sp. BE139]